MEPHMQMKWLVTILDRGRGNTVADICNHHNVLVQLIAQGRGTASSDIKMYLGLGEPEKDIVLSLAPYTVIRRLLPALRDKLQFSRAGHGIAFTIPLSGISLAASQRAVLPQTIAEPNKEDATMSTDITHDLIITVVDSDNTDIVFDAAKEAGCRGGTIAKAREVCSDEVRKVFGITIQPEKEIVMILVPRADKQAILKAICNKILSETGERGMAFSLPVADVVGLASSTVL